MMNYLKLRAIFLGMLLPCLSACYQGEGGSSSKYINASPGDRPRLEMTSTDGKPVNNQSLKGKIVVLDFWASWCGPCMAEAPHMVNLYNQYAARGVNFVGVNFDQDKAAMEAAVRNKGLLWPQVWDGKGMEGPLASAWGLEAIPQVVILSREGVVLWAGHPAEIDAPLAAAVGGNGAAR